MWRTLNRYNNKTENASPSFFFFFLFTNFTEFTDE